MLLPNAECAAIDPAKLRDYLLNAGHADGASKAAFLALAGYRPENWRQLEHDLRSQHAVADAMPGRPSPYGRKYEIVGPLLGPNGAVLMVRTVWIVRHGHSTPEFVTLVPEPRQ